MTETQLLAEELRKKYDVAFDPERSTFHYSVLEFYAETGFITDKQLQRLKKPLFPLRSKGPSGPSFKQVLGDYPEEPTDFEAQYGHDFINAFLY